MRRSVLLLLVAVLCLRVWAGEAMAGQMLEQQVAASHAAMAVHGPDCAGAMAGQDEAEMACGSCLHCQDCSLNALPAPALLAAGPLQHVHRPVAMAGYSSAEPLPELEPPIA
jgi:hypothetical protein